MSWGRGIQFSILIFSSAVSADNEVILKSVLFNILLKLSESWCEGTVHLLYSKGSVGR